MNNEKPTDIITLKDLILVVQDFIKSIFKSWYVVAIFAVIGSALFLYNYSKSEIKYRSELRFVVEGQNGTGGGLGGLLGSIGIRKGNGISPFKILEVGKSNTLFLKLIYTKDESGEFIGNKILETYDLIDKWSEKNSALKGFRFTKNVPIEDASNNERIIIRKLNKLMWNKDSDIALANFSLDEMKGIFTLKCNTIDENLSYALSVNLYKHIKAFFEEDAFANQRQFSDILTAKSDSLRILRDSKIRQIARFNSKNIGLVNTEVSANYTILNQEQIAINGALIEVLKNKEMADVNLKDIQPLFLKIDAPFRPLPVVASSLFRELVIGGFIGVIFSIIILIVVKIYRDAMA